MRTSQKLEIQKLLEKANRFGKKYYVDTSSQGSCLMSNKERVSPILKPTAFVDWLDAFTQGQEVVYEQFGIPLVEVTNGMRDSDLLSLPNLASADGNIVNTVSDSVMQARVVYYNNYA